ncbi:hypothetical protein ABW21_db0207105 [Orbilia brochopaga]|nr:hypothetical protein ABW21_db0207105 [Drechslerella brochopaga]
MCFFNRFRFQCGHQQYVIFQLCPLARHTRGRTYHTSCRPSKRSHPNFRKWDMLGYCETCLRRHGYPRGTSLYSHGIGVPSPNNHYNEYNLPRNYDDILGDGYPYYPYSPNGYGRRGSGYIDRVNPDECDSPGCMTITTPKDINNSFYRSGYGRPHMGSRRLLDAPNPYANTYPYGIDGRWYWGDRDDMAGRMSSGIESEDAERYPYDGVPMRGDPYVRMPRGSGRMGPEVHVMD